MAMSPDPIILILLQTSMSFNEKIAADFQKYVQLHQTVEKTEEKSVLVLPPAVI